MTAETSAVSRSPSASVAKSGVRFVTGAPGNHGNEAVNTRDVSSGVTDSPPSIAVTPGRNGAISANIVADNLSEAWLGAFDLLMSPGVDSIEPLVVTITGFDSDNRPAEAKGIRDLINRELRSGYLVHAKKNGRTPKHTPLTVAATANTIFPESLWNPAANRDLLYSKYLKLLSRLKRDSRNRRGLYFERLISYGRGPEGGNQLEHMLRAFEKKVKRTSAYQATIADPITDSTKTPFLGFPCLQQIAVHPSELNGSLAITGFYGTQYLFARGYGNFLGLCGLGRFLAIEMGLKLQRLTCIASYVPVEAIGKTRGRALIASVKEVLANQRRSISDKGS